MDDLLVKAVTLMLQLSKRCSSGKSKVGHREWLARGALGALLLAAVGCRSATADDPAPNPFPVEPFALSVTITGNGSPLKVKRMLAEYVTTSAACAPTSYLKGGAVTYGRHLLPVSVLGRGGMWVAKGHYDAITPGRCAWKFAGIAVEISDASGQHVAVAGLSSDVARAGSAFLQCVPSRGSTPGSCYRADPAGSASRDRFFVRISG